MEVRHKVALETRLDTLMDTGIAQVTVAEYKRWHGVERISSKMLQAFSARIEERIEEELPEEAFKKGEPKFFVYSYNEVWTFIIADSGLMKPDDWEGKKLEG